MAGHVGQVQIHQHQVVFVKSQELQRIAPAVRMLCPHAVLTQHTYIVAAAPE